MCKYMRNWTCKDIMKTESITMSTESRNPRSAGLSEMSTEEIVRLMNEEDAAVITAVNRCIPEIAAMADLYAETLKNGGRVFYLGAGTSGGLALLDAAEVPPTFGLSPDHVIALTAEKGICYSTDEEDSLHRAAEQLQEHGCNANDFVIGVAASGSTPYVAEGMRYAKSLGAKTGAVVCNEGTVMKEIADITAEALTGPEVLTGSTRLKAGSAEKMILNILSTAAMVRLGKVYSNYMVDVKPMNQKLVKRATSIIMEVTGCDETCAAEAMKASDNHCMSAIRLIRGKTEQ